MYKIVSLLLVFFSFQSSFAQQKFWIKFNDKDVSTYCYENSLSAEAIKNRIQFNLPLVQYTDVPLNSTYLNSIIHYGVRPIHCSKWLNAISALLTSEQIDSIKKLPFVTEIIPIDSRVVLTSCGVLVEPSLIHIAMKQMEINSFIKDSLSGMGVLMGVIDAGFFDAHSDKKLKHLFDENKILGQRDFVSPERTDLITIKATDADSHGRSVLDMIAGYNEVNRELTGMAINSKFYLARSEDGNKEYRGEEDTWVAAMEWMDSCGVRLISTSLGYAIKMDDPKDNYSKEEIDGKTTRISKAAQIATDEKGIFLVVSAGNEGNNINWQIISSPADARGVLAVGATKSENYERMEYSSIGPKKLPYLKPNVSCYSRSGTSFSAPAVAGFVSCLMQKAPYLNNKQLKDIIEKSCHLYPYGNNYIGYGIPRASRALKLIGDSSAQFSTNKKKIVYGKSITIKNNNAKMLVTIFHKESEINVIEQKTVSFVKGKLRIIRPDKLVLFTTVAYQDQVIELVWK